MHDCLEVLAYEQGYRVEGVCRELGLEERRFRRMFLRDVGLAPKDWMAWERMVVARRLLGAGRDPLVVSERLGFSHPNSFRREFRTVYGVTVSGFLEIRLRGPGARVADEEKGGDSGSISESGLGCGAGFRNFRSGT